MNELHNFMTGSLWLKLKADVADLRVLNQEDLRHAAYFHIRRLLLVRHGWACRSHVETGACTLDFVVSYRDRAQAALVLEFLMRPGQPSFFPADLLSQKMADLTQAVQGFGPGSPLGYLAGVFDCQESWFFPESSGPGSPSPEGPCFWLGLNCREFPNHESWRADWDRLTEGQSR